MSFEGTNGIRRVTRRKHGEAGVASVVALMLLLAVIVTFLSLYATTYLPALKQQAEIEQVTSVKEAFMRFDNDIDHVISDGTNATYGETVPLGGGDILLDPEKSSGLLSVGNQTIYTINLNGGSSGPVTIPVSIVNVSYVPSYSFWEAQGYSWQYGYINVTKGDRQTPLSYNTMGDVNKRRIPGYAGRFFEVTNTSLDSLVITAVTMEPSEVPGDKNFVSGNGACVLRINATVTSSSSDASPGNPLTFSITPGSGTDLFTTSVVTYIQSQMNDMSQLSPGPGGDTWILQDSNNPVNVTVNQVRVSVYVQ